MTLLSPEDMNLQDMNALHLSSNIYMAYSPPQAASEQSSNYLGLSLHWDLRLDLRVSRGNDSNALDPEINDQSR
jgi:hypothetical protein